MDIAAQASPWHELDIRMAQTTIDGAIFFQPLLAMPAWQAVLDFSVRSWVLLDHEHHCPALGQDTSDFGAGRGSAHYRHYMLFEGIVCHYSNTLSASADAPRRAVQNRLRRACAQLTAGFLALRGCAWFRKGSLAFHGAHETSAYVFIFSPCCRYRLQPGARSQACLERDHGGRSARSQFSCRPSFPVDRRRVAWRRYSIRSSAGRGHPDYAVEASR